MSPLSSSVYSSVLTYNPNVLMRPYQYLTTKASKQLHHIICVSLEISISIVKFGDQAHAYRVDTLTSHQKRTRCQVSWLFDELSDNNVSNNGLSLSVSVAVNEQISEVILTPVNDAIPN